MHDHTLGESPPSSPLLPISRRNLLRTGAWSVPTITVARPLRAFADSSTYEWTLVAVSDVSGETCDQIVNAAFTVTVSGPTEMPADATVEVTLPDGLAFASGPADAASIPLAEGGALTATVTLPAFQLIGLPGSYSIAAEIRHGDRVIPAAQRLVANISSGPVTRVTKAETDNIAVGFSFATSTAVGSAVASASAGNTLGTSTAVILGPAGIAAAGGLPSVPGHSVVIEGPHYVNRSTIPRPTATTMWTMIDTFASDGIVDNSTTLTYRHRVAGIVANDTHVTEWREDAHASTKQPFVARSVNDLSGTVVDVAVENGRSYALTTTGLYSWFNSFSSTTPVSAPTRILTFTTFVPGTSLSTWTEDRRNMAGSLLVGALVNIPPSDGNASGSIITFTTSATGDVAVGDSAVRVDVAPPPDTTVTQIEATPTGIVALGADERLYFRGSGHQTGVSPVSWNGVGYTWQTPETTGGNVTVLPTDVRTFSAWGAATTRHGGLWITATGDVGQWFGNGNFSHSAAVEPAASQPEFTDIAQVSAADGSCMALDAQGEVWAWGGNLNQPAHNHPTVVPTPAELTAVRVSAWGLHHKFTQAGVTRDHFNGGGHIHQAVALCSPASP